MILQDVNFRTRKPLGLRSIIEVRLHALLNADVKLGLGIKDLPPFTKVDSRGSATLAGAHI